jgi:hypothetical protein
MALLLPFFLLIIILFIFVVYNFLYFLINGKIKTRKILFRAIELWALVIVPIYFLSLSDFGQENDCCSDSALFSPGHRIGIYCLITAYTISYIISMFRKEVFPPIAELFVNAFLILGVIINVILCIHINGEELGFLFWFFGNIPIVMLLLIRLAENQKLLKQHIQINGLTSNNVAGKICESVLQLEPISKYSILILLLIPVVILLSLFLLIFGQKLDSIIKAFTDTYQHGFSQLDYMCNNVECGAHYLCSVAANGHAEIVRPQRRGIRNGNNIVCNRQLLISNAFEELLQENIPFLHKHIRRQYNKVGNFIHRYYRVFNNKYVADFIYILMKPAEWFFLFILYTFDKKPENKIAKQYISKEDRHLIDKSGN